MSAHTALHQTGTGLFTIGDKGRLMKIIRSNADAYKNLTPRESRTFSPSLDTYTIIKTPTEPYEKIYNQRKNQISYKSIIKK